jgi:GTP pyrophosphokinase
MWTKLKKKLSYLPKKDIVFIKEAFKFARTAHTGQKRESGEDYFVHPAKVAQYLAAYKFPKEVIAAGLLHDVLEDTSVSYDLLTKKFGKTVANLVDGVSVIGEIQNKVNLNLKNENETKQYLRLQKLILASAKDVRVIFIRLLDRKHNLETLQVFDKTRQERKAHETLEVYVPLAKRIGMGKLANELEDSTFAYLSPKIFKQIQKIQTEYAPADLETLKKVKRKISFILAKNNIKVISIDYRTKHLYSLYNKLKKFNMDIGLIYDLAALRIILETEQACYETLGLLHATYPPMVGRIKDYIANPKPNGYQSLHTTVFVKGKKPVEIQIRTASMHHFAEHGLASHWLYKEKHGLQKFKKWFFELNNTVAEKKYSLANIFAENIYVFTPKGEIIELPQQATALDFAYAIHSDIGHHTNHVLVNGRIRPLDFKLHNSDIVEIKTSNHILVSPLWLKKVETNEAKNKIRTFLRDKDKDVKIRKAQNELTKKLKFYGLNPNLWETKKEEILEKLKENNLENLYLDIYEGKIEIENILKRFFFVKNDKKNKVKNSVIPKIIVSGEKNLKIKLAKCCSPSNFKPIIGYISKNKEIAVHQKNCPNLVRLDKTRFVPAWWEGEILDLKLTATDRVGLIFDITNVFKKENINIIKLRTLKDDGKTANLKVAISYPNMLSLTQLGDKLAKVQGIKKVIFKN